MAWLCTQQVKRHSPDLNREFLAETGSLRGICFHFLLTRNQTEARPSNLASPYALASGVSAVPGCATVALNYQELSMLFKGYGTDSPLFFNQK